MKKKMIAVSLSAAMLASGLGMAVQAETLTESAKGFAGDVTVTVEVEDGKIASIEADGPQETPERGGAAITEFNETLLQSFIGQETDGIDFSTLDTVSGATVTSDAVRTALVTLFPNAEAASAAEVQDLENRLAAAEETIAEFEAGTNVSKEALGAWLSDRSNVAAASSAAAFLPGEENAPTDEELERILTTANNYTWCHMLSAPHFIVIRDAQEQETLLKDMGITGDGTVTVLVLADGVSDQEHHQEQYTGRDSAMDSEHYWQMYYCIYEAGEAAAMLNLAALSEGYRIRSYGALDLYNQGVKDQFPDSDGISIWYSGGNFDYIQGDNWDISKYTSSKDGSEKFTHWFEGGYVDGEMTGREVSVEGNLTLLCAIVIGSVDESNVETSTTCVSTTGGQNTNFDFWD